MAGRILLVDDAPIMRLMLKDILEAQGYEIVGEAENGKQAVELYDELQPDLVTMDIVMPEMNGIEALKAIMGKHPKAVVIMITAMDQRNSLMDVIKAGAFDYILKPLEEERVVSAIGQAFQKMGAS